ncbi:MAG: hypothetical protein WBP26_00095 [Candidatus Saccharimonadales bacterium]
MDKDKHDNPNDKNVDEQDEVSLDDIQAQSTPKDTPAQDSLPVDDKPIIDPSQIVVSGKGHRNLILVIVLLLIIAIGIGVWLYSKKSAPAAAPSTGNTTTTNTQPKTFGPVNLVYATSEQDGTKTSLYWRGMGSGTPIKALDLPANTYISQYAVRGEQAAVAVEPGSNSGEKLAIWYSSDSGKTYKKIYTDKAAAGANSVGSQITSLVFSSDAKSLVYGYLPDASVSNTVMQLALSGDYKTTELFSEKQRGVFLQGYDAPSQQAVYYLGCYNCDGNTRTDLMIHDGTTGTSKTLLTTVTSAMVVVKEDGTELIAANGTPNPDDKPGLEKGAQVAPFTLQKVQLSDGKATTLATLQDVVSGIGYTAEGDIYYNTGMKVVRSSTTPVTLYEAQKDILNTFYADKNQVISSVGDYQNFMVNHFVIKTQANTTLLDGVTTTRVLGVTHN